VRVLGCCGLSPMLALGPALVDGDRSTGMVLKAFLVNSFALRIAVAGE